MVSKARTRDTQNVRSWRDGHPAPLFEKPKKPDFYKVMAELRETVPPEYEEMVGALVEMYETEERPYVGLVGKLAARHGRTKAREFLAHLKTLDVRP